MAARKKSADRCGIPGCENKRVSRGACTTCLREINDSPEYEAKCLALGFIDPRGKPGRPRSSRVKEALKSRR